MEVIWEDARTHGVDKRIVRDEGKDTNSLRVIKKWTCKVRTVL